MQSLPIQRNPLKAWPRATKFSAAFGLCLQLGDLLILVGSGFFAYWLRFGRVEISLSYMRVIAHCLVFALLVLNSSSLYRSWRGRGLIAEVFKLIMQFSLLFAIILVYTAALKFTSNLSRIWAVSWFGLSLAFSIALRVVVRTAAHWVRAQGMDLRSAIIVGANREAQHMVETLHQNSWVGIQVRGWFATDSDRRELAGVQKLGQLDGLGDYVDSHHIDQVWLALPVREQRKIAFALRQLEHSTANIRYLPDLRGMRLLNHSIDNIAGLPVINLRSSPLSGNAYLIKYVEDRLLAALILVLILPLLAVIAVAVKLSSPGPILFRQLRHGIDGRLIEVWKFRTMRVHQECDGKVTQATRRDPRITPLGAFLRRTSLDELPQFFNVLQGTMSIVGPRPHAIAHNEHYKTLVDKYMQRHRVKPGITGWAQVNGLRGETDKVEKMAQRVRFDLYYLQNWSLRFDLKIIMMTVIKGFFGKNAY